MEIGFYLSIAEKLESLFETGYEEAPYKHSIVLCDS